MITEAIILAGGFGTRLTNVVDVPKPMAPINGTPFLQYLMDDLLVKGITTFYIAVGYQRELIMDYFGSSYMGCKVIYVVEEKPLGTGGAIQQALTKVKTAEVFVVNGDTFFDVDLERMHQQHKESNAALTIALKPMKNFERYGVVEYNVDLRITKFSEKKMCTEGSINGGVYLVSTQLFEGLNLPESFSMEHDYFEQYYTTKRFYACIDDGYFIDIGIPADYERAQGEL